MKVQKRNQGFTLIELMVVITIIAILASITVPVVTKVKAKADLSRDISNCRQVILACKSFASDWDGVYPAWDPDADTEGGGGGEGGDFSTSTDAFNVLIKQGYIDTESIFWMQTKNPEKLRPPKEDGELEQTENCYTYVMGLTDTSFSRSPLVADEQEGPGTYGEYHPWLEMRKAVVGYSGGHVNAERLDSAEAGAKAVTKDGIDIFAERTSDESSDGLLATSQDGILHP